MARRIIRDTRAGLRVGGPAGVGQNIKTVRSRRGFDDETVSQFHIETAVGALCNSCRKAMFEAANVGGSCVSCGNFVCAECAQSRCAICNACCCDNNVCSNTIRDRKVCTTHGFGAYLKFAFTKSR